MPLPADKNDTTFLPWLCRTITTIRGTLTYEIASHGFENTQNEAKAADLPSAI